MQTALFEHTQAMPRARRTDPNTSHEAAATARNFAAGHRALILETLKEHQRDGMTVHEIAAYCRLDAHAIGKRSAAIARAKRASKQSKLTDEQVMDIRLSDDKLDIIAARHGVSQGYVWRIRAGIARRDFTNPFLGLAGGAA
jgi:hypothetical protein